MNENPSIAEMWAKSVKDKTSKQSPEKAIQVQTTPVKPVNDQATESRKAQFRQNLLNTNNKQKEQING